MKKQLVMAAGILLTLGTAVSATKSVETDTVKTTTVVDSATRSVDSTQSAQIVALWKTHASSPASVPLARPL
jgi:hypothetical protein